MNKELFGVFGGIETFKRFRSDDEFDEILEGKTITAGIRDSGLGAPGWSATYSDENGICLIWGEAYVPGEGSNAARWLLEQYSIEGEDALRNLNGSYLAVLDADSTDQAFVATDMVRSRSCFYTDGPGVRVFGTDASEVGRTLASPKLHRDGVLDFLHLGVTLGEKTWVEELFRLPLDSQLTSDSVTQLDRFVYEPRNFDYVQELADRLERAIDRRSKLPGTSGLLLSAGYDSRILLSQLPDIEQCYTVGYPEGQEVTGAKRLAEQYDVTHTSFPPDERYLRAHESKVRYSQGIKESLHIHHAGYTDQISVDTIHHGLLCDTFFRGHFTEQAGIDVLGKRICFDRLNSNPDPVEVLLERFGYIPEASLDLADRMSFDHDVETYVRETVGEAVDSIADRADQPQNELTGCGIANQPSIPFHNHLSDHFFTGFLATDAELVEWHLQTPPEYRTTETFLRAFKRIDENVLRHRPPDRPHDTELLNEAESFVRRKTPFLSSFDPPWPNRDVLFDQYEFDQRLLPELECTHPLPARHKLRINDIQRWLGIWSDRKEMLSPWLAPSNTPSL
ncbi:asparagine synthetase B family protein [Halostagnicola bangensis]